MQEKIASPKSVLRIRNRSDPLNFAGSTIFLIWIQILFIFFQNNFLIT